MYGGTISDPSTIRPVPAKDAPPAEPAAPSISTAFLMAMLDPQTATRISRAIDGANKLLARLPSDAAAYVATVAVHEAVLALANSVNRQVEELV